jgi:hypothetical protein
LEHGAQRRQFDEGAPGLEEADNAKNPAQPTEHHNEKEGLDEVVHA